MTRYFSYLSDPLYVDVMTSYMIGNVDYHVDIKPVGKSDDDYETVYNGAFYSTGKSTTRLHLDDIINSYTDDYQWFKDRTFPATDNTADVYKNTYIDVRVVVDFGATVGQQKYYIYNIINGYLTPNMEHELIFDVVADDTVYPLSLFGYNITPHIPYTTKFWTDDGMQQSFNLPVKLFVNSDVDRLTISTVNPSGATIASTTRNPMGYALMGVNLSPSGNMIITNLINSEGYTISASYNTSEETIAVIDYEPAEYYLMWINRHGAIQCQPFCKKNTVSESVSTSYINSLTNEATPSNKTVEYNWTLNSHWLTYDEHNEFESLLTSKYVWLYDTARGWNTLVNVADSKWTYKNTKHHNRPFNMTVNLKAAQNQNITY